MRIFFDHFNFELKIDIIFARIFIVLLIIFAVGLTILFDRCSRFALYNLNALKNRPRDLSFLCDNKIRN